MVQFQRLSDILSPKTNDGEKGETLSKWDLIIATQNRRKTNSFSPKQILRFRCASAHSRRENLCKANQRNAEQNEIELKRTFNELSNERIINSSLFLAYQDCSLWLEVIIIDWNTLRNCTEMNRTEEKETEQKCQRPKKKRSLAKNNNRNTNTNHFVHEKYIIVRNEQQLLTRHTLNARPTMTRGGQVSRWNSFSSSFFGEKCICVLM